MKKTDFIQEFHVVFKEDQFNLPRPNSVNYQEALKGLLTDYVLACRSSTLEMTSITIIEKIVEGINNTIEHYYNGLPQAAFDCFSEMMKNYQRRPLIYKSLNRFGAGKIDRGIDYVRVSKLRKDEVHFGRKRVFHVPYSMRERISNFRYSISGFPCLYLGSTLELCCKESRFEKIQNNDPSISFEYLASGFRIDPTKDVKVFILDVSVTPQTIRESLSNESHESINLTDMNLNNNRYTNYFFWYPLIAACSFVRRDDSVFVPEYIIPQLLMQWLRDIKVEKDIPTSELLGIAYFSCESDHPLEGTNYVFPTSGKKHQKVKDYCKVLSDTFEVSMPQKEVYRVRDDYQWFKPIHYKKILVE